MGYGRDEIIFFPPFYKLIVSVLFTEYHFLPLLPFVVSVFPLLCFWVPHSFPWVCYQAHTITTLSVHLFFEVVLLFQEGSYELTLAIFL